MSAASNINNKKDFEKYVGNMNRFIASLPPCNVAFLFFYADHLDKPCIICTTKKYSIINSDFYIVQGQDPNYFYVYSSDNVKFLVTNCRLKKSEPAAVYSVDIVDVDYQGEDGVDSVFLGNHLDFSISNSRKSGPFFKIHYTEYEARGSATVFGRNINQCNIDMDPHAINGSLSAFKSQVCYNNKLMTIGTAYAESKYRVDLIQNLARIAIGGLGQAGAQDGGTPFTLPMKKYKNIHIGDSAFHEFIKGHLFHNSNSDFESATMILDLENSQTIYVWVHFTEYKEKLVMLNAHQALKAAHAFKNPATASGKEYKCLAAMAAALKSIAGAL